MKKVTGLLLVFALSVFLVACNGEKESNESAGSSNSDQDVYTLKMSTQQAETAPIVQGFSELAEKLEEKSDGRLLMEVYPSAQLGSDDDVIEQAEQGVNVAVLTDGSRMGVYVKDMGIIGAPYFLDNYDEVLKLTESESFKSWEEELVDQHKVRVLSFNWYDGPRHFLTNKVVENPEDLKGQRIRTPGSPVWQESIKALGATPVAMPWGDVYTSVQQGAIDGAEAQHTSSYPSRIYEVIDYVVKTNHFQLINGIIVGEKWFESLPEDLQELLVEETKAMAEKNAREIEGLQEEYESMMVDEGMEVIEPNIEKFKESADKAYEALNFVELREKIYEEIGKTN